MYGNAATKENDWAFDYLPKVDRNYSWTEIWNDMFEGKVQGNLRLRHERRGHRPEFREEHHALKKADFLVVCEIYPDETSEFWRAPGITPEEMKQINTTVYRLPGAGFAEKDGTFVNSARWLQWKYVAVPPPGDAKLDQEILARIFLKIRDLYKQEGGKFPDPILNAVGITRIRIIHRWPRSRRNLTERRSPMSPTKPPKPRSRPVSSCPALRSCATTDRRCAGTGYISGSWTEAGAMIQRRGTEDPSGLGVYPNWAWSWPANRRVMYNRASCDLNGKPWDPTRAQIWWNESTKKWVGNDVPDFKPDSAPSDHMGPFIMNPEGVGRIFVPLGMVADGPFPEHYESVRKPDAEPAASAAEPQPDSDATSSLQWTNWVRWPKATT